jgi:hypothetical protein
MAMLSEKFWGKDTYEHNHKRENLCPYSMVFHSVGGRSHGRICPGKTLALTMLTDALVVCGKVRRSIPVYKDYFVGMDRYVHRCMFRAVVYLPLTLPFARQLYTHTDPEVSSVA